MWVLWKSVCTGRPATGKPCRSTCASSSVCRKLFCFPMKNPVRELTIISPSKCWNSLRNDSRNIWASDGAPLSVQPQGCWIGFRPMIPPSGQFARWWETAVFLPVSTIQMKMCASLQRAMAHSRFSCMHRFFIRMRRNAICCMRPAIIRM